VTYRFAGVFARPAIPRPKVLPSGAVWRDIAKPFAGVGVRLPALIGETPAAADVESLTRQLGMDAADCWLYLTYDCWGGSIDFVYGLGSQGGVSFGPVEESALDKVETVYVGLMGRFGLPAEDALRFQPFERGYWGEE
jgi:hypothetical protein